MRVMVAGVLALAMLAGCGSSLKRLSDSEREHYYALRVWMTDAQKKAFLKGKTQAERDAYLQSQGLWDSFYKYSEAERDAIVAGDVRVGWPEDKVLMSWGPPFERRRLTGRPASRSELFVYRFEVDADGYVRVWEPGSKTEYKAVQLFQRELFLDDRVVTEIVDKERWE